ERPAGSAFVVIAGVSQVRNGLAIAKSDRVAVGDNELRVSARIVEKQGTLAAPRTPVRSTPSSANSPAIGLVLPLLSTYGQGTAIEPPFTLAQRRSELIAGPQGPAVVDCATSCPVA